MGLIADAPCWLSPPKVNSWDLFSRLVHTVFETMSHCRNMSAQDHVIHKTSPRVLHRLTKLQHCKQHVSKKEFVAAGYSLLTMLSLWLICMTHNWFDCPLNWGYTLPCAHAGKDVADRWYDEVKQYNFNRPGFSSGTGEIQTWEFLSVRLTFFDNSK